MASIRKRSVGSQLQNRHCLQDHPQSVFGVGENEGTILSIRVHAGGISLAFLCVAHHGSCFFFFSRKESYFLCFALEYNEA